MSGYTHRRCLGRDMRVGDVWMGMFDCLDVLVGDVWVRDVRVGMFGWGCFICRC